MTLKDWGKEIFKQLLTVISTLAVALLLLALKAPFIFKQNVEKELSKKADIEYVESEMNKKVDKSIFEAHAKQQIEDNRKTEKSLDEIKESQKEIIRILFQMKNGK